MAVKDYVREHPSTVEEEIGRLETYVFRMERRYECKSDEMATDVHEGRARETAEISRWLGSYEALRRLRQAMGHGPVTG